MCSLLDVRGLTSFKCQFIKQVVIHIALDGALPRYLRVTASGAHVVKSSCNLNTPKAEVGIALSRYDFHFWNLLLCCTASIASPQGTVLKIQVELLEKSC